MQVWEMEDLIPLVAKLADQYTSKDSSSVSYETARMLMEAVIYCIREWEDENEGQSLPAGANAGAAVDWEPAYRHGYEKVLEKVRRAKGIYEELIAEFEDYECRNYRDTIVKGIPAFFVKYDPKFCPQDHILTLDYPAMSVSEALCGADRILEYLRGIQIEAGFLRQFPRERVIHVLREILPEYRSLYLDNICAPVLMRAVECMIAGTSVLALELDDEDDRLIEEQFRGDDKAAMAEKIRRVIGVLADALPKGVCDGARQYFEGAAGEFAVRMRLAMGIGCI